MRKRTQREAPKLPRFNAPKRMTLVKFMSKRDRLKLKRVKKVDDYE